MAIENIIPKNTLKGWFKRGLKPLESQFAAWMDSYWHKSESIPTSSIEGLEATLNSKAEALELSGHLADFNNPHRVCKEAVGLGSVDNTADLEKPVSKEQRKAIDEAVREASDVVLTGTGEVRGSTRKTFWVVISVESRVLIQEYAVKGKSLVGARLEVTCSDDGLSYTRTYMCTYTLSGAKLYKLTFLYLGYGGVSGNQGVYQLAYNVALPRPGVAALTVAGAECYIETGNYVNGRYNIVRDGTHDMNDCVESGGVYVRVAEGVVVNHLPDGVVEAVGSVLSTDWECTQIVTETTSNRTYLRVGFIAAPEDQFIDSWTPWRRIDCAPEESVLVLDCSYTVAEMYLTVRPSEVARAAIIRYVEADSQVPVVLKMTSDGGLPTMCVWCTKVERMIKGPTEAGDSVCNFFFSTLYDSLTNGVVAQNSKALTSTFEGTFKVSRSAGSSAWRTIPMIMLGYRDILEAGYVRDRYVPNVSFDMNDFNESGGISAYVDADVVGLNVPEGFTDIYGYVLSNDGYCTPRSVCCTQVVIDRILLKTMQRSSVPTDDGREVVWTPWSEVGGAPVVLTGAGEIVDETSLRIKLSDASKSLVTESVRRGISLIGARLRVTYPFEGKSSIKEYVCSFFSGYDPGVAFRIGFVHYGNSGEWNKSGIFTLCFTGTVVSSGAIVFGGQGTDTFNQLGEYDRSRYVLYAGDHDLNELKRSGGLFFNAMGVRRVLLIVLRVSLWARDMYWQVMTAVCKL